MHVSRSFYRLLLRTCPADLRRDYGTEMEEMFVASLANASGIGKLTIWLRAVADLTRHGVGARADSWRREITTSAYIEYRTGGWWMDTLRYDLRHALRAMSRQPTTSAVVVLTLALAIGANTAVFSAVHTVLIRPLPYPQPGSLVMVWEKREAEGVMNNSVSPADYLDWARMATSFTGMAAMTEVTADLTGEGDPEKVSIAAVSAPYFDVFGIRPLHGRTFEAAEYSLSRRPVVLSHAFWRQRFGGDPRVVNRSVTLNGSPFTVVGVLPANAVFPYTEAQIFLPLVIQANPDPPSRSSHQFSVYARLKPGVTFAQARAEMDRIGKDLEKTYPDVSRGHGANVTRLSEEITGPVERTLIVLMAAVAFILLIACINVANLLLANAAGRRREMAVRAAVGAGRLRLLRQALVDCGVMATIGAAAGVVLAAWAVPLLSAQLPAMARPDQRVIFSAPVLGFTCIACVVVALLAGALPAWQLVGDDPAETLKEGGRGAVSLKRRLRFGLIVAEVALTSLLLVGAGLTLRSFQAVLAQPAGIETEHRLTFRVSLPGARYKADGASRFNSELESRLSSEPLIQAVGAAMLPPLTGLDGRRGVVIENRELAADEGPTRAHPRIVTVNYIQAIGAHIREGRAFLPSDTKASASVAIVNDTMARRYWRGGSPIGKRVRFSDQDTWFEVVGVLDDVKHWGLDAPVNPEIYIPSTQSPAWALTWILRTNGDPLALVPIAQRHIRELDAAVPIFDVRTMDDVAAKSMEKRRWMMTLMTMFAVLALALAAAGIYGVMAHLVSLRTPEIGVRLTLGATPASVMRQVMGEGAMQAAIGLGIGLIGSLAVMRGLRTILFGIEPTDPITLVSVGVSLMLVALLAVAIPAYRAMRVDPIAALRE